MLTVVFKVKLNVFCNKTFVGMNIFCLRKKMGSYHRQNPVIYADIVGFTIKQWIFIPLVLINPFIKKLGQNRWSCH